MDKPLTLDRRRTMLLVVDVQQRLHPVIHDGEAVLKNIRRLVEGAAVLDIPALVSEQYPKGLGPTVDELQDLVGELPRLEKLSFSCLRDDGLARTVEKTGRDMLLICGTEAHVCVLQTALDAVSRGLAVHVPADAVGSRNPRNREIALARMREAGATVTCTESALFEMLKVAGTDEFKRISRLVK